MKKKEILIGIIIVVVVVAIGISSYFILFNKKEEPKTQNNPTEVIKKHIAYISINPSIKIEYIEKCLDNVCEEPVVTTYELINDDAKELFKNVNLLDGDKTLAAVIETICETVKDSNIEFTKVEITSDWEDINNYINENKEPTDTWTYNVTKSDITQIENSIKKEETSKQEENNTNTTNTPNNTDNDNSQDDETKTDNKTTERDSNTIYLSDNVTYTIGGEGYCCNNCFSDALIKEITNAKGYKVTSADGSRIDFMRINLSSNYNNAKYNGTSLLNKIKEAGSENCGGLGGGEPEPLTKEICTEYHLKCE